MLRRPRGLAPWNPVREERGSPRSDAEPAAAGSAASSTSSSLPQVQGRGRTPNGAGRRRHHPSRDVVVCDSCSAGQGAMPLGTPQGKNGIRLARALNLRPQETSRPPTSSSLPQVQGRGRTPNGAGRRRHHPSRDVVVCDSCSAGQGALPLGTPLREERGSPRPGAEPAAAGNVPSPTSSSLPQVQGRVAPGRRRHHPSRDVVVCDSCSAGQGAMPLGTPQGKNGVRLARALNLRPQEAPRPPRPHPCRRSRGAVEPRMGLAAGGIIQAATSWCGGAGTCPRRQQRGRWKARPA